MRDIARLLFGDDAGRLLDLFDASDEGEFGMAERARRAGEWCASTPGHASAAHGAAGPHGMRRQVIIREFRTR